MVVCRPAAVIPANAGIQQHNAAGLYRKKPNPHRRHSRAGGNPKTQRNRNLSEKTEPPHRRHSRESGNPKTQRNRNPSEKTETPPTVIPAKAGIQQPKNHRNLSAKTETPTASFPQKLESKNATQQEFIGKNRNPTDRHSRKSGN
ncbi:TPA: hypothetical protein ACFU4O_002020, partial [Neisseria meningitidis]